MPDTLSPLPVRLKASTLALLIVLVSTAGPAWSVDKKETQRRAQQAIRHAQAKAAELERANVELDGRLKEQEARAAEAQQGLEQAAQRHHRLTQEHARELARAADLEARLKAAEEALQQVRGELADTRTARQEGERLLERATAEKTALDETLAQCIDKNGRLYQLGRTLIDHVEKPGPLTSVLRAEPFTQIKRVELENIFQDARDDLDRHRLKLPGSRSESAR